MSNQYGGEINEKFRDDVRAMLKIPEQEHHKIYTALENLKKKYNDQKIVDEIFLKKILFSNLILISVIFLVLVVTDFYPLNLQFLKPQILLLCAMIPFCIIFLIFSHLFIKLPGKIMLLISLIAFATYAIYLFQHQFLAVFALITDVFIQNVILQDVIILTFGFVGAILCGIIIQKIEQYLFMKYSIAHQR